MYKRPYKATVSLNMYDSEKYVESAVYLTGHLYIKYADPYSSIF